MKPKKFSCFSLEIALVLIAKPFHCLGQLSKNNKIKIIGGLIVRPLLLTQNQYKESTDSGTKNYYLSPNAP